MYGNVSLAILMLASLAGNAASDVLASWNIQNLGWNNDKGRTAVSRIASEFDLHLQRTSMPETRMDH